MTLWLPRTYNLYGWMAPFPYNILTMPFSDTQDEVKGHDHYPSFSNWDLSIIWGWDCFGFGRYMAQPGLFIIPSLGRNSDLMSSQSSGVRARDEYYGTGWDSSATYTWQYISHLGFVSVQRSSSKIFVAQLLNQGKTCAIIESSLHSFSVKIRVLQTTIFAK